MKTQKNMGKRKDLLTGEEFEAKRIDQKFKSRENQIKYNNQQQNERRKKLNVKLGPLSKNQRILEKLMKGRASLRIHKEFLRGCGFVSGLFTHMDNHKDKNGVVNQYPVIFSFMLILENEHFIINRI